MKTKLIVFVVQLILLPFAWNSAMAQNACEKYISTNYLAPYNLHSFPQNRYNPWINSDFYIGKLDLGAPTKIELNNQMNWSNDFLSTASTTILKMNNPYTSDGTQGARYDYLHPIGLDFEFRDYKWGDGWELLWLGTGYYPNGEPLNVEVTNRAFAQAEFNPGNGRVPYVVLYNRYRGVMRVFMNLVTDFTSYSNIKTELNIQGTGNLNGILRHLEPLDRALDQTTNIDKIESFNPKPGDWNQWYSIDYNLGFDPCICGKNQEITIKSFGIDEFHLEMYGRGISAEVPIIQDGQPNYDLDWLTQHDINSGLEGGNRIFTTMDGMIEDYQKAMTQYAIDNRIFQDYTGRKAVLDALKGFVVDGAIGLVPAGGTLKSWFLEPNGGAGSTNFKNYIKGSGKGLLGYGYDQLSMGVNPKTSQPKPPDMPTATFSEIRFTGDIKGYSQPATIGPFFVPGSYDEQSALSNLSSPYRYPAYNVPTGMAALLRTPEPLFNYNSPVNVEITLPFQPYSCYREERWSNETSLRLRFDEELLIALNPSLDFDMDKTATYIHLEITLEDGIPEYDEYRVDDFTVSQDGNLFLEFERQKSTGREYIYKSRWILLEDLNQFVFSLDRNSTVDINKNGIWSWDGLGYQCNPSTHHGDNPNFLASDLGLDIKEVKMKVLHDYYFDQIGSNGEQVNTTQVFSYLLFQKGTDINFLGDELDWGLPQNNLYNEYIIGEVELGDGLIALGHPTVSGGNNAIVLFVDAQQVLINGDISTPYNSQTALVINALDQIHLEPGAVLRPKHKRLHIKKDFYDVPVFTYTSSTGDFCDTENGGAYLANYASKSLKTRNPENEQSQDQKMNVFSTRKNIDEGVSLFPNPANSQIWISSSSAPISEIQIIDIAGRVLIHEKSANPNVNRVLVNINSLQTGVYIVQAQCGNERSSQKLVIGK